MRVREREKERERVSEREREKERERVSERERERERDDLYNGRFAMIAILLFHYFFKIAQPNV